MQNPFITISENKLESILLEAIKAKVIKVLDVLWIISAIEDTPFGKVEIVRQDGKTLEILEHGRRRQPKFLQKQSEFIKLISRHIKEDNKNN